MQNCTHKDLLMFSTASMNMKAEPAQIIAKTNNCQTSYAQQMKRQNEKKNYVSRLLLS